MIHEISCIFHVLEHGFMYVSVCINTWYIHDTYMKIHVDRKCLRLWEEKAEAEIEDMRCATGYTLKKIEKREPDWNDDAGANGAAANVSAWCAKLNARPTHTQSWFMLYSNWLLFNSVFSDNLNYLVSLNLFYQF